MKDGYFSPRGINSQSIAVWLWPSSPEKDQIQLGVTTGTWEGTSLAAEKINACLGVDIDFDRGRAQQLLEDG